jgi:hypothetical protein
MAGEKGSKIRTAPPDEPNELKARQQELQEHLDRNEELCTQKYIEEACLELYKEIEKGYSNQWDRSNDQMDYWDIYNCKLGPKQFYSGNSKTFLPIVTDAVRARKTRFTNQIFPPSGKNVDVITSEDKPQDLMSLLEFYIRKCRLRTEIVPALMINGDVEGHYNLYVRWETNERNTVYKEKKDTETIAPFDDGDPNDENETIEFPTEEYYDIIEDKVVHQYPVVEVLADSDVLVLPITAASIEAALACGGSVTILRKWSKTRVKQLIDDGEFEDAQGKKLLDQFAANTERQQPNKEKKAADAAGIKTEGDVKVAVGYETWTNLTIDGDRRLCRVYYGGEDLVLGTKRNPYWCDLCPVISAPSEKIQGVFKGTSRLAKIDTVQYAANDFFNEGMDSAHYTLQPIVLTDPLKNPRTTTMILNTAAVWEVDPQSTQFAKFPELYQHAKEIVAWLQSIIFQHLSVNPAMIPQMPASRSGKTNQAQVAQEQQVDLLTTADVVTEIELSVLTPLLRWFVYLDHQFRDEELMLKQFGLEGRRMAMDVVLPIQFDRRFEVRWFGVESARTAQQLQIQMATVNMVRQIPPDLTPGFKLVLTPVIQQMIENNFGPRIGAEVFQDQRRQLSLDAEFENELLADGFDVPVSVFDDDQAHMKTHMELLRGGQGDGDGQVADPTGHVRQHMMMHKINMQKKQQMAMMQAMQQQAQGQQQGGPGSMGPRPGAKPGAPRGGGQNPAGTIHQDQLRGTTNMPRARNGGM